MVAGKRGSTVSWVTNKSLILAQMSVFIHNSTREITKLPWQRFAQKFLDTISKSETHDCKDHEKSRCPRLKEEGYCESTNPEERLSMRNNCALTCNFCRKQHFFKEAYCLPAKANSQLTSLLAGLFLDLTDC